MGSRRFSLSTRKPCTRIAEETFFQRTVRNPNYLRPRQSTGHSLDLLRASIVFCMQRFRRRYCASRRPRGCDLAGIVSSHTLCRLHHMALSVADLSFTWAMRCGDEPATTRVISAHRRASPLLSSAICLVAAPRRLAERRALESPHPTLQTPSFPQLRRSASCIW